MKNHILKKLINTIVAATFVAISFVGNRGNVTYALEPAEQEVIISELDGGFDMSYTTDIVVDEVPSEPIAEEVVDEPEYEPLTIEEKIKVACDDYGVPFDIVLAIARLETGWFKSHAYIYGNNPGGLSVNERPIYFDSIEEGVDRFVSNLAKNYFAIGLTDPWLIGQKYCPANPDWPYLVSELMSYGV